MMRPLYFDDAEAIANGYDPLQQEALDITHQTREELAKAPLLSEVWKNFTLFVNQFKTGNNDWGKPVMCGYNIDNYDKYIIDRLCQMYGPYSEAEDRQSLFHPVHSKDLIRDIWTWTENNKINSSNSISMDSVREWLGIDKDKAHNALKDVFDGGFMLIKFLKLYRSMYPKIKFKDSFTKENEEIKQLLKKSGV